MVQTPSVSKYVALQALRNSSYNSSNSSLLALQGGRTAR